MIRLTLIALLSYTCWSFVLVDVGWFRSSFRNENTLRNSSCKPLKLRNGFPVGEFVQNNKIYDGGDDDDDKDNEEQTITRRKEKQRQMKLDGLEPYVLVSAITSTASFEVITQGNYFSDNTILSADGSSINLLKAMLLLTSTLSSTLGLYALGVFSFSILYSKAALAREYDDALDIYEEFLTKTAKYRYKGFICFYRSLQLFILNLFLFAFGYLPGEDVHLSAVVVSVLVTYLVSKDLQDIVEVGEAIFSPPPPHKKE
mmetsp:Transcript_17211/g.23661  ORF Transcript_17211/g.23661 Transcript_17211/m.23661 type:complete len:258 (-) Transcript_17211:416-1189(-)|eukprot:CAMPEP_0185726930 /NCGR_PEP_ID=MMETSP1171-20130828/2757_1 /TAXON_ID=374046 /ORGANISM="Helicotheca tamensis, Strain CCMP826" /LENGTH=257 /DNA_ID=CAMNT_0028395379 /DNA_START=124 /DNA_END=897 /DNA_ORIENTATION=-